jgi:branched-chain amino acid transport system substrate-binding protein
MRRVGFVTLLTALSLTAGHTHAQISDGIVKIGVLNDESGPYATLAGTGSRVAALMAVEDFGAAAKGLTVEIIFADHQNKVDIGSSIARKWYETDKVDVIVDVPNSSVALAVNQIARDKGKAFLNTGAASSDLTGRACSPNTIHWTYDTWALANGTARAIVTTGGDTWVFLTANYTFGLTLERDTEAVVVAHGGKVLGRIRHPFPTSDFSSFLLEAQASQAKIIGLANAGADTTNAIEQGTRLGIVQGGQHFAGLLVFLTDVHALGLNKAQRLMLTESFYWDLNEQTRAWSARFARRHWGAMPTMAQGGSLLGGAALPQGGGGAQERRGDQGDRKDEGTTDRRPALRQGHRPSGRPEDPSHVPLRGEEAGRVQESLGLLQAARDHPGRRGVPPHGPGRLPAGQEVAACAGAAGTWWRSSSDPPSSRWSGCSHPRRRPSARVHPTASAC